MNPLQIVTADTLTYNAEDSANAFAVVERIVSLAAAVLRSVSNAAYVGSALALRAAQA